MFFGNLLWLLKEKKQVNTLRYILLLLIQEVLSEIQRLKEEANRFISILSAEDDPEKADELLSPGKRQSLTREVESLQLVVEMRTAELHKLREERTRHLQQLEELERTSDLLEKANARVEDLTVQLAAKTELER